VRSVLGVDDRQLFGIWGTRAVAGAAGSFKSRLASAAVSRGRHVGADTVVAASTGNAGVAVAACAEAAGPRCAVLARNALPGPTGASLDALSARVLLTRTFADR